MAALGENEMTPSAATPKHVRLNEGLALLPDSQIDIASSPNNKAHKRTNVGCKNASNVGVIGAHWPRQIHERRYADEACDKRSNLEFWPKGRN